jgi:FdrA protein
LGLQDWVSPLYSNVPVRPDQALADPLTSQAHTILDLGEDLFTVGRLHPMLDNDLRIRRLRQEAADPDVSLIYLDVVLGDGAHPDPAAELTPVIAEVRAAYGVEVVVVVIGTDEDPQDVAGQIERFEAAGAAVFRDVTTANSHVAAHFAPPASTRVDLLGWDDLNVPFAAINIGLESFHDSLIAQGADSIHVVWKPPAAGNEKLMDILAKLRSG